MAEFQAREQARKRDNKAGNILLVITMGIWVYVLITFSHVIAR